MKRHDWITDGGVLVVGLAAAILTFTTLSALGLSVGYRGVIATGDAPAVTTWFRLAWLLPITIDAAGIVAARVWLRGRAAPEAVEYARKLALACIGLSVAANGGQHLLELAVRPAPWWVVLPVTSIPPAVLAATVHLGHLLYRTVRADGGTVPRTEGTDTRTETVVPLPETPEIEEAPEMPETPDRTVAEAWEHFSVPRTVPRTEWTVPRTDTRTERTDTPDRPALAAVPELAVTPDDLRTVRTDTPDRLLPKVRELADRLDRPLSAKAVRAEFNIGHERAVRLVDAVKEEA